MKRQNMQIIRMYGLIGEREGASGKHQTLELNLMKWKDGRPVYDLRWWEDDRPLYGISINEQSLAELGEMIDYIFEEENKQ